jgi:DMSO reductase anchor subunit
MKSSWRSWFWNIIVFVLLSIMAGIFTGVTVQEFHRKESIAAWGFAIVACLLWVSAIRSPTLGVTARPNGIVVRNLMHTTTIPWNEIAAITSGRMTSSAAGLAGATAPVVTRIRPGKPAKYVELRVLGGYGISRKRPTLGQRAVADLNSLLEQSRKAQPAK